MVSLDQIRRPLTFHCESFLQTGNISLDIFTLNPGGIAGKSHLRTRPPLSVRVAHQTQTGLRPFLRMLSRSSINKAHVPAKVIAKVAFQGDAVENCQRERYYILDSEYEAASVVSALRNGPQLTGRLVQVMREAEGGKNSGSPTSIGTLPVLSLNGESEV